MFQHLGLGSVIYCFVLALLLWLLIWPLRPSNWTYWNVLIFVSMTSPPALLYAIPVERFMSLDQAIDVNACLLAIVAIWRMALLFVYLRRSGRLGGLETAVATLVPVCLVVVALTILNLDHVVFEIMDGIRDVDKSPQDGAYAWLFLITALSIYAFPILLLMYIGVAISRYFERKAEAFKRPRFRNGNALPGKPPS